jgi:hypothetical protein
MADPLSPLTGAKPVPLHVAFGGFHLTLAGFDRPFDLLEALGGPLRAAADAAGPGQPPMINEAAFRVAAEAAFGAALSVVVIGTRALLQPLPYRLQMPEDFPALPPDMMPEAAPPDPAPGAAEKTLASAIAEALAVPWPEGAPAPSPDPIADAAPEADTLAEAGPAPDPGAVSPEAPEPERESARDAAPALSDDAAAEGAPAPSPDPVPAAAPEAVPKAATYPGSFSDVVREWAADPAQDDTAAWQADAEPPPAEDEPAPDPVTPAAATPGYAPILDAGRGPLRGTRPTPKPAAGARSVPKPPPEAEAMEQTPPLLLRPDQRVDTAF